MNPTYVPLASYSATPMLPLFNLHALVLYSAIALAISALPLLAYAVRWALILTKGKRDDRSAPGLLHAILVVLTLPVVFASGYLLAFGVAAWHFDGGYACSDATPFVAPRIGHPGPGDNLCFVTSTKAKAQANSLAQSLQGAASAGINVINGGQR